MVQLCHGPAHQEIQASRQCIMVDLEGSFFFPFCFFFCQPVRVEPQQAITVGEGVCEGIHHNIVSPRASFSHTRIIEIVH